jgi:NAD(P)H-flavin reductase
MVENIVKKIMVTGINKYAKKYDVSNQEIQILVKDLPDGIVTFEICKEFKVQEQVTFLQIMDKKMDIFQYEALASPYLKKSLEIYAENTNDLLSNVNCFIMKHKETVGLAFYNGFKSGKNILLAKQLEQLGL